LAGKQGFLFADKSVSWQGRISGKPVAVHVLPSHTLESEGEEAKN